MEHFINLSYIIVIWFLLRNLIKLNIKIKRVTTEQKIEVNIETEHAEKEIYKFHDTVDNIMDALQERFMRFQNTIKETNTLIKEGKSDD